MAQDLARRLESRVASLVLRAVVRAVSDGTGFQTVKVEALDDVFDKLEHLQQGGVSHVSLPGAEGVLLCPMGRRNLGLVILASNRDKRPKTLAPGETALWTAIAGALGGVRVHCKADGTVVVGSQNPATTDFVALAAKVDDFISRIDGVLRTDWVVLAGDGGAALKTAYTAEFASPPASTASTYLKGD